MASRRSFTNADSRPRIYMRIDPRTSALEWATHPAALYQPADTIGAALRAGMKAQGYGWQARAVIIWEGTNEHV